MLGISGPKFGRFQMTLVQNPANLLGCLELRRDIQSEVRGRVILWEQPRHMDHPRKLRQQAEMVDQHLVPAVRRMCPKGLKIPSYQQLKKQL